mgnify:CR=1 FL=1
MSELPALLLYFRLAFYATLAYGFFVLTMHRTSERRHTSRPILYGLLSLNFAVLLTAAVIRIIGGDFLNFFDYVATTVSGVLMLALGWRLLSERQHLPL